MEAQSRNVVQALVRDTARSCVSVGCSNHNVRFIVHRTKLSADTLHQLITQRLPTGQRIEYNNEVALTRGSIHSNESACVLASMHTATLLRGLTVTHEADLTGLTGNIRRTCTNQVGGSTGALRGRSCRRNLASGKNCGCRNKARCTNTSKRMHGCFKA